MANSGTQNLEDTGGEIGKEPREASESGMEEKEKEEVRNLRQRE